MTTHHTHGAVPLPGDLCRFEVWAPDRTIELVLPDRTIPLEPADRGWRRAVVDRVPVGTRYSLRVDGGPPRPDPASRFQPEGLHGPSEVVGSVFPWSDAAWKGLPLPRLVISEVHIGTFTDEGTFDAAIPHLDGLCRSGFTAVEVMPVAQFPGGRNWGYDGAAPFAVQNTYGGPAGFRRFVDACHERGLAVVLDVVYNHLGPEGNYLWGLAPYFTERYRTPWGAALNFDGAGSDEVRSFFIQNALMWIRDFHVDALRLDAVHAIVDVAARPFVEELAGEVRAEGRRLGRTVHVIAESDRNDPRLVLPADKGGLGLDAVWNDDFHHVLHVLLTGEKQGYYADFGGVGQLAAAIQRGFVYTGQYSTFRGRRHGAPPDGVGAGQFLICAQNHDQIGNRIFGDRLSTLIGFEQQKLAAAALLLSPGIPLLFMGEEYGETAPFQYFVSHGDPGLVEAVRRGRREEFAAFREKGEPPDPQETATFSRCRLNRRLLEVPSHRALHELTRTLLAARRDLASLADPSGAIYTQVDEDRNTLLVRRGSGAASTLALYNFSKEDAEIVPRGAENAWSQVLDTSEERWLGPGNTDQKLLSRFRLRPFSAQLWRAR
ncbi:MAG: malto-oligosyltrehalose trehalohydrolase [Candidatus Brocadiae bacterium]|nr:malto-oligosyltrehalose trehalohydrolase [Candidatus Brocadiia bacterium]